MFPFDLSGPEFLAFYLVFAGALIGGLYLVRRRYESGPIPSIDLSDPLLFACLRGGPQEAVRVATLGLVDRGILQVADGAISRSPTAEAASLRRRLDREVLSLCDRTTETDKVADQSRLLQVAAEEYESVLRRHRLIPDTEVQALRIRFLMIALAALVAVGGIKLLVALSGGRSNVGFLIVLMILAVVLAIKARGSYRTAAGESCLGSIRSMFSELQRRATEIRPGSGSRELLWLTALFGAAALPASAFPFVQRLWPQPARSTTTSGCGASHSSGCGGGGSGGGGGCGGCGS